MRKELCKGEKKAEQFEEASLFLKFDINLLFEIFFAIFLKIFVKFISILCFFDIFPKTINTMIFLSL